MKRPVEYHLMHESAHTSIQEWLYKFKVLTESFTVHERLPMYDQIRQRIHSSNIVSENSKIYLREATDSSCSNNYLCIWI